MRSFGSSWAAFTAAGGLRDEPPRPLGLAALLLTGYGVVTQAAIIVGGSALERWVQDLENPRAARCATNLVRKPDGSWWRCGQLESPAEELAEADATKTRETEKETTR